MSALRDQVDDAVRDFYAAQPLDPELRARLRAELGHVDVAATAGRDVGRGAVLAAAAMLAVALAVLAVVSARGRVDPLPRLVAAEIALNHRKQLEPDVVAGSYEELRAGLDRLDFTLVRPRRSPAAELRLVGGRHCSVLDAMAAQLRVSDDAGRAYTLYEFRDDGTFAAIREARIDVDGVRVTLWRESGLVLGLAGPRP